MTHTIKGPALFLAQFAGGAAQFNSRKLITEWAADCSYEWMQMPFLRKSRPRHDSPFPLRRQPTRTMAAVPRAEQRFMSAMRIWITAVWRSGSLAAIRSPKAFRQRIFASILLRTWYPVHRFQNARP